MSIIEKIKANYYSLYALSDDEVKSILCKTYYANDNSCAMVVETEDAGTLYGRNYNPLVLGYVPYPTAPWLHLSVYSIDDSMWRAILPLSLLNNKSMFTLWEEIKAKIPSKLSQNYFIAYTRTLGVLEYDWN